MGILRDRTDEFWGRLMEMPREELMELVELQDPALAEHVRRIEWVFKEKLGHLTWPDGTHIDGRPLDKFELALLIDEPFEPYEQMTAMGLSIKQQKEIHIAKDTILWAKEYLGVRPRAYQVLMLRHPSLNTVFRAGRRLGKTYSLALKAMHYAFVHKDARVIVLTPMKSQGGVIYQEILKLGKDTLFWESIERKVTSPQYEIVLANGSTIRFFSTGMKCLTPDHDVLTRDGWESIANIQEGTEIASYRSGEMIWSPVNAVWDYDFDGELISHSGRQLSFRATPNHRFLAKTRYPDSQYRFVEAKDLKDYYLPVSGTPMPREGEWFSGDELELWGWWLSEGAGFIGKMARFSQYKESGRKRLVELAERLGLHYTTPKKEIRIEWRPPIECGATAYNKFIPRLLMEERKVHRLMQGLVGGDGHIRRKGWEYSSSSWQLINDVQELAIRLGLKANLREKDVSDRSTNRHWVVSAYPSEKVVINKKQLGKEKYNGKVHCVTVEDTGTFLVRHEGKVHITGNSGGKADVTRGQEAHVIILDELDYMGDDDLEAVLAMLQQTAEGQEPKELIGASTPTGRRSNFWKWCHDPDFKEFWFPSYVNPLWNKELEDRYRRQYTEMGYRHEFEADWGEDVDGVYPRRFVDRAFWHDENSWEYVDRRVDGDGLYVMGVDWDKYGAGCNFVVLQVYPSESKYGKLSGKIRVVYREETPREAYTLINAVERVKELDKRFNFAYIYIDRGYGEVQEEMLKDFGVKHPSTGLATKVKGISFSSTFEVPDPYTHQMQKKDAKPFMIDNLRQMLESERIIFPEHDETMYAQLISYIVSHQSHLGRPIFTVTDEEIGDHIHDALILACLAITQNYSELVKVSYETKGVLTSRDKFMSVYDSDVLADPESKEYIEDKYGSIESSPIMVRRPNITNKRSTRSYRPIKRKMF